MGAAVAKALEGIADAPGTLAEARLAVAAHAVRVRLINPNPFRATRKGRLQKQVRS